MTTSILQHLFATSWGHLIVYIILTFGFAWLLWDLARRTEKGELNLPISPFILTTLGAFSPGLAAFIISAVTGGWIAVGQLLGQALIVNVMFTWYIIALLLPAMVVLLATGLHVLLGGKPPAYPKGRQWFSAGYNFLLIFFLGGPLGEEFGWRGFALPILQEYVSPIIASLILGIIWSVWHLPLFNQPGSPQSVTPKGIYLVQIIGVTFLFTWLYNGSGSLLIVLLFHTALNGWAGPLGILPTSAGSNRPFLLATIIIWMLAILINLPWQ